MDTAWRAGRLTRPVPTFGGLVPAGLEVQCRRCGPGKLSVYYNGQLIIWGVGENYVA